MKAHYQEKVFLEVIAEYSSLLDLTVWGDAGFIEEFDK